MKSSSIHINLKTKIDLGIRARAPEQTFFLYSLSARANPQHVFVR